MKLLVLALTFFTLSAFSARAASVCSANCATGGSYLAMSGYGANIGVALESLTNKCEKIAKEHHTFAYLVTHVARNSFSFDVHKACVSY